MQDAKNEKQPRVLRLLAALVAQDDESMVREDREKQEKQPQVLRLLAALVAQDDSVEGGALNSSGFGEDGFAEAVGHDFVGVGEEFVHATAAAAMTAEPAAAISNHGR